MIFAQNVTKRNLTKLYLFYNSIYLQLRCKILIIRSLWKAVGSRDRRFRRKSFQGRRRAFRGCTVFIGKANVSTPGTMVYQLEGWNEARGVWRTDAETNGRSGFSSTREKRGKFVKRSCRRRYRTAREIDDRNNDFVRIKKKAALLLFRDVCQKLFQNY